MGKQINDGGSAQPFSFTIPGGMKNPFTGNDVPEGRETFHCSTGMTLRDHFAGLAMQGYVSGVVARYGHDGVDLDSLVEDAWDIADLMIAGRAGGAA